LARKSKKILVPFDGSRNSFRALYKAVELAKILNAKITALYVVPLYPKIPQKTFSKIELILLKENEKFFQKARKICEKTAYNSLIS
jgi:nucleotide-binding universal stress UspA family protein